ncbi:hypothetical protein E2562_009493 [Oryza meyeriana var. granulata]|uniref:Uncharacterized protein n=1 Tax=Oryza meyeriana var. granulata TaxID=110450 RepID=A0A6G1BUA2_9ORYZ|nr:hypothetical protein E2562_009493 [Oryza meyeriana var. granulata]
MLQRGQDGRASTSRTSEPNPSESSDATASDATASDQISEDQEGSPVHPDDLLEARDSPQRSPQRDDVGRHLPHVEYTRYKATGMRAG